MSGSALHWAVRPATMTSADFCLPIPPPLDGGSTRQVDRPPRVRRVTFIPHTRRIYFHIFRMAIGLRVLWPPRPDVAASYVPLQRDSSGRNFACGFLQIPDHPGHPCCSASPATAGSGLQRTCTFKWVRPAGRTTEKGRLIAALFYNIQEGSSTRDDAFYRTFLDTVTTIVTES